jgi:acid phosphatase family membrane protein YuiD
VYGAEFAIAFGFSFLFWYDAANVRFEAWQHASFLNRMSEELDGILDFWWKFVLLKERLWHTAFEVAAWVIVWVSLTLLYILVIEEMLSNMIA